MAYVKFFLDTNALLYLSGLKDLDLKDFKKRVEASGLELSSTHVQVDESTEHIKFHEKVTKKREKKVQNYQEKIAFALKSLRKKEIDVRVEPTKIPVQGVARQNYTLMGGRETGKLYDELQKEVDECEKAKGNLKSPLNIGRDAVIAVSSLDHDFFITTDKCLFDSWHKIITKHRMLKQKFKVPKVIYTKCDPKEVARSILEHLP